MIQTFSFWNQNGESHSEWIYSYLCQNGLHKLEQSYQITDMNGVSNRSYLQYNFFSNQNGIL